MNLGIYFAWVATSFSPLDLFSANSFSVSYFHVLSITNALGFRDTFIDRRDDVAPAGSDDVHSTIRDDQHVFATINNDDEVFSSSFPFTIIPFVILGSNRNSDHDNGYFSAESTNNIRVLEGQPCSVGVYNSYSSKPESVTPKKLFVISRFSRAPGPSRIIGVFRSGTRTTGLDTTPAQLAQMLSDALREIEILKREHAEEKRRATYWEGVAKSYKVVEDVYGGRNGGVGSPSHSPTVSTSATNASAKQAHETLPQTIVEHINRLNRTIYEAECARDDEEGRKKAMTDLWFQLRDELESLDSRALELRSLFDKRVLEFNSQRPADSLQGLIVERAPQQEERLTYDERSRVSGTTALARAGPPYGVMGPPPVPSSSTEGKSHRKRRSGSIEGGQHGHISKKSRVQYPPPPAPIHPPSLPSHTFNPLSSGPGPSNHVSHSAHPLPPPARTNHSHQSPHATHILPPTSSHHQPYLDPPHGQGQGQFVWASSGQPGSSKQQPPPPPPPQGGQQPPLYTTFSSRERERGRQSSLPRESRDIDKDRREREGRERSGSDSRRRRERSRSVSSDKSIDDMILDATASGDQAGGNQLPPIRYGQAGHRRSSRERSDERGRERDSREYQQRRSPPPHYLPPPLGQKMYPPPLAGYQGREVYPPGEGRGGERATEGVLRTGENGQGDPHHHSPFTGSHGHTPHALTAHPTIPNATSLSSIPSSSITSHSTIPNSSSHPSIPAAHQTSPSNPGSQSSIVQPGSYPPTNAQGQRICRQCGQPGRYKEGKCVEKWGPGPHGPGTVCDRCRKKMKRVERRGTIEQAQAVAAAQAQAARQQAAMTARAEAARLAAEAEQRDRLEDRDRGRFDERRFDDRDRDRMMLTRVDTIVVSSSDIGGSVGSFRRERDREREYSPVNGRRTPITLTGSSGVGELAPPRTIIPAGGSGSYRGSPLPPRSPARRDSPSHRPGSRSGSGEDVDVDAEGDIDDGDGEDESESPTVHADDGREGTPHNVDTAANRGRSRGGSGGSTASRGSVVGSAELRRGDPDHEDPEVDLLEAVDAAEQSVKSE
ncbi:hypothetical protein V5O48_007663 [Marasmius crinis-equi]|uniref:GATA-type domain-containing protein n=1 Tax=Marasmius crinis-equi TaxID=585013 RepID=A0ABR3FG16_9AGAR